jgi:hypothetical protein
LTRPADGGLATISLSRFAKRSHNKPNSASEEGAARDRWNQVNPNNKVPDF